MSSSRDVIVCKQAAFGVAMGNAGEEVKRQRHEVKT
jgi:hydroxymethylpyrimidine pyrophosphatase-like HAD family hydrolase